MLALLAFVGLHVCRFGFSCFGALHFVVSMIFGIILDFIGIFLRQVLAFPAVCMFLFHSIYDFACF